MSFLKSVRASPLERTRPLPGDEWIPDAIASFTHAVTIRRPREEVWPWLAQMGAGRGGWYSYDFIDNGRRHSADRVVPGLQPISVGALFPALPGVTDGFHVLQFQACRHLVLAWRPSSDMPPMTTWAFVLEEEIEGSTRLIVRARGGRAYPFYGLPPLIGTPVIRFVHFMMERKQLLTLASRVEDADPLLDSVMPEYDVAERHRVGIAAPANTTLAAAASADLQQSHVVRAVFKARELILGSKPDRTPRPKGLLAETQSLGWRVLAQEPGREIVVGAVTQPWLGDVVFRGLALDEFRAFREPGYVKIAWTLRADPDGPRRSVFRTETRVMSTDAVARKKFRAYWVRFSPGIVLIRRLMLRVLKAAVESGGCPVFSEW